MRPPEIPADVPAPPVPPEEAAAVLADVARIGPWFAVTVPAGPAWQRWDEVYRPAGAGGDPLSARIDQVAAALGTGRRIAASIAVQGMAARLVSAPFAAVALHATLPRLAGLRRDPGGEDPWAPALPGGDPGPAAGVVRTPGPAAGAVRDPGAERAVGPAAVRTPDPLRDPAGAADLLARELARTHLEPLYAAVTARVGVSGRVLRGNVVSAVAGAARVLDPARPAARPAFLALLGALADHPVLRGPLPSGATGAVLRHPAGDRGPSGGWAFRRRSCCLYVHAPGGGACGDCVLR
ncbi:(2Fe-2S)-binding protein [Pseudonocardia sp. NPDC046786]|uniref:(2Fe-2S)-binding protein n=1 Tax=Pseudonocardia sp. NPDC046786 TaxID=3155471 RepID=UPI0033D47E4F